MICKGAMADADDEDCWSLLVFLGAVDAVADGELVGAAVGLEAEPVGSVELAADADVNVPDVFEYLVQEIYTVRLN